MKSFKEEYAALIRDILPWFENQEGACFDAKSLSCFTQPQKTMAQSPKKNTSLGPLVHFPDKGPLKPTAPAKKTFSEKPSKLHAKPPVSPSENKAKAKPSPKKDSPGNAFSLAPLEVKPVSFYEVQKKLKKIAPNLCIHKNPLDDKEAKQIKEAWKIQKAVPMFPIFYSEALFAYRSFLENIAKAVEKFFGPSRLVPVQKLEKENTWGTFLSSSQLRLILVPDILMYQNKNLMAHYLEYPREGKRFLGEVPVLLLPDLSLYFKDPLLKRSLWTVICQMIHGIPQ
ncbi:MAG: hypothetical protein Tsb0015_00640 [Simkaniaceae bacterium]